MSNVVLPYFWDLASADPDVRAKATDALTAAVVRAQESELRDSPEKQLAVKKGLRSEEDFERCCAEDLKYCLKRLARGLPSPRDGARMGFALGLTEVSIVARPNAIAVC